MYNTTTKSAIARFLIGFFFQGIPGALLTPLLAFDLAARGVDATLIGALATVGGVAYMVALSLTPALIERLGERRGFRLSLAVTVLANLGLALSNWPVLWVGLYALAGLASGLRFTLADSWLPAFAPPAARGRLLALFQTSIGAAFFVGAGVLLLSGAAPAVPRVVAVISTLLAPALLWPTRPPQAPPGQPAPARQRLRAALAMVGPSVLGAALLGGVFESGLAVALPLYGLAVGAGPALASGLITAIGLGSLGQYPFGALADRYGWQPVAVGAVALIAASALLLPLAGLWAGLLLPIGLVWGSAGGGLYTLASIRNGTRWRGSQLVGASVVTQFAYMVGDAAGPLMGGMALDLRPGYGLPALAAIIALVGLGLLHGPIRARPRSPEPQAAT
jgi:MFS family permease